MQETDRTATTSTGNGDIVWPKWINKVAWFVRITGILILVASTAGIIQAGWPHSLRTCGSLSGIFGATMLLVMSFLYTTTGRAKIIVAAATIVLGLWVIVFSVAVLVLPHP